ncbi:MAG: helix-hairpin-helix domain-containing protein [Amoebophilaceae bacterium]|jgi:DNA uptake protein ComE-like DNA-binding protein|nr:helix-hairpin-helix domain-containing protein [Amoebophilaceae bacterium]
MFSWISARLRAHFGFSKAETNGTLVLLLLASTCLLLPQGLKCYYRIKPELTHDQDIALLEDTLALLSAQERRTKHIDTRPKNPPHHPQSLQSFDINTADAVQLSTIKGIGPVLSARILKFRDNLGGFTNQAQYQEIYGLRPEVLTRLKQHTYICVGFQPNRLNINTADFQTLVVHPYITYQQARSIVHYRAQNGPFATIEELDALKLIDETTLTKVKPYLFVK